MKKFLLSIAALAMSLTVSAQVDVQHQKAGVVEQCPYFAQQSVVVQKAAKKIAANQRWLGYYNSDALTEPHKGMGIPGYPGENKVAICLSEDILKPYVGKNIVGMRFGLTEEIGNSSVSLFKQGGSAPGAVCRNVDVQNGAVGWNEVKFDEPYTIQAGETLYAGYSYTQLSNDKDYKSFPFSAVEEGLENQSLWVYCKIGNNAGWNEFNMGGANMSIQVLVEGDFAEYAVLPEDFGTLKGGMNKDLSVAVKFMNNSKEAVSSLGYVVSVDGVAGSEQSVDVSPTVGVGSYGTFKASVPCGNTEGLKEVKVEVTKVNGHKNGASSTVANGKISIADKMYERNVCIEEFTTEKCGNCPRVAGFLHTYLEEADPTRVFAVCHHAGYYTDWLTKACDNKLLYLFNDNGGSFAPAMMFNREPAFDSQYATGQKDNVTIPGSAAQIKTITNYYLDETMADAKLDMTLTYDEGESKVIIVVTGESNKGYDTENALLTVYLTEDNVKAKNQSGASKFYHQHVIRDYNSNWGDPLTWNDNKFSATYEFDVDEAWKKDDLKVVAFLNKHNTKNRLDNRIENVTGKDIIEKPTAIESVGSADNAVEVARYNAAGQRINGKQKGLNIVKLSNGTTLKVVVK